MSMFGYCRAATSMGDGVTSGAATATVRHAAAYELHRATHPAPRRGDVRAHREYLTPDGTSTPTRPDPTARRTRQAARSTRPQGPYLHTGETRAGARATPTVACNHRDKPLHTQTQETKQDSRRWLLLKFRMQVRCMPVRYGGKRGYAPFAPVPVPLQVPSS